MPKMKVRNLLKKLLKGIRRRHRHAYLFLGRYRADIDCLKVFDASVCAVNVYVCRRCRSIAISLMSDKGLTQSFEIDDLGAVVNGESLDCGNKVYCLGEREKNN